TCIAPVKHETRAASDTASRTCVDQQPRARNLQSTVIPNAETTSRMRSATDLVSGASFAHASDPIFTALQSLGYDAMMRAKSSGAFILPVSTHPSGHEI